MTNVVTNLPMLSEEMLTDIQGGGKNGADLFLAGVGGAVEGVALCLQAVPFPTPQIYAVCAAGGAVAAIIWPR
ncbi:Blp family class II bacteriocin [Streptococcus pluranimalium]|uniref:Blp family class II bacteriocin n=1 Tax=Streptococcus pluranimalium TaxID=82348 RepID=UPI0039FBFC00